MTASRDDLKSARQMDVRVKQLEERLANLQVSAICAFNQLLDLKDLGTGVHSTRLAEWSMRVGQALMLDDTDLRNLEVAAILHDVGKIGVPDAILNSPLPLTDEGWAVMKKHPEYGWAIVRLFPDLLRASLFILHHHERVDGQGYPGCLKADEIPIGARIVSVIDAFDAMVSNRPYRQGMPAADAIRRLTAASGTQFDPRVVECFVRVAEAEYPDVFQAAGTGVGATI